MAENPDLLTHLRDFLIEPEIVRDPRVEGDEPPFWRQPQDGAIAPGEKRGIEADSGLVVSAFITDGVPGRITENPYWRTDVVTLRIRTAGSPGGAGTVWGAKAAMDFDWKLRARLVGDHFGDREGFVMAGLEVISLQLWRPLSMVGSDEQGFDYSTGYLISLPV